LSLSFLYSLREGLDGMRRARLASTMSTMTVAIALVLLGLFIVGTFNLARLVDALRGRVGFEVFIDSGLDDNGIDRVGKSIRKLAGIRNLNFLSRDDAAKIFQKEFGDDVLEVLQHNPLPASFTLELAAEAQNAQAAQRLARQIEQISGVDEVVYRQALLSALDKYIGVAVAGNLMLGVIVALSSFALVVNVIRLTIEAKHRNIEIMQLVGATPAFIRRPFLIQGLLQGLLGGLGAALVVKALQAVLARQFGEMVVFPPFLSASLMAAGMVLAVLASFFGVRRYLR